MIKINLFSLVNLKLKNNIFKKINILYIFLFLIKKYKIISNINIIIKKKNNFSIIKSPHIYKISKHIISSNNNILIISLKLILNLNFFFYKTIITLIKLFLNLNFVGNSFFKIQFLSKINVNRIFNI